MLSRLASIISCRCSLLYCQSSQSAVSLLKLLPVLEASQCVLKQTLELVHQAWLMDGATVVLLGSARWHTAWQRERERHYSGVRELAEPLSIYLERTGLRLLFCRGTWLSNLALRMILFVSVVCLALALLKTTRWAVSDWIHSFCPTGTFSLVHLSPTA